jgi:hypothetical protein
VELIERSTIQAASTASRELEKVLDMFKARKPYKTTKRN